ncbi:hypothetical protein [Methylobacterium sp. Leaf456]|uniref:hypothetical protein n=1 Tax=Methylobacterium sp. Leaf456 TaxID=1736382 RepID=UPI000A627A0B|nr:hypothetical protein [Methylobacterium sp. Leaf456]
MEYKSSGEYTSAIPTISYTYENKFYLAKPVGSYRAEGFLKDAPIKIFVNPKNPEKFSIKSLEVVLAPLFILAFINLSSIAIIKSAFF